MLRKHMPWAVDLTLTALVCINLFFDLNHLFHSIIGTVFILYNLYLLTSALQKYAFRSWLFALLIILGIVIIPTSIIYYFYQLNAFIISFLAIAISAFVIAFWIKNGFLLIKPKISKLKLSFLEFLTLISYLFFIIFLFYLLIKARSDIAVPTPWALIDKRIFILYFTSTLILIIFFIQTKLTQIWKKILMSLHFLISFSVCWVVYKLGFGYDPFIHQKTVEIISEKGFILPKPLYYLGQYSLEVFLHKISLVNIDWLDRLLLPILSAIYLPTIIFRSVKKINPIAVLVFLAIPYSFLTFTTPQNLSFFFSIIVIFLCLRFLKENDFSWWWLGLLSIMAVFIHPLTGLPILLFAIGAYIFKNKKIKFQKFIKVPFIIISSIIIPLAFLFINLIQKYKLDFGYSWHQIGSNLSHFFSNIVYLKNNFRSIYDLLYFYGFNYKLFIILFLILCIIIFRKKLFDIFNIQTNKKALSIITFFLGSFLITVINYLILKNLFVFEELIYYERSDYAQRLIILMFLFLIPIVLVFFSNIIALLKNKNMVQISFSVLISLIILASFYLSYPRYDNIYATHGRNVSAYDFEAVEYINQNASEPYIVLANQNTSVAAVKLYGFEPVYNEYFYYPIPTGNKLYQYFLMMVNNSPKIEYIDKVKELTGVQTVYFVLPYYWNNFNQLKLEAKKNSQESHSIDSKIQIYRY